MGGEGGDSEETGPYPTARPVTNTALAVLAPKSLFITNDFPPRVGGAQSYYWGLIQTLDPSNVIVVAPDQPGSQQFDRGHSYRVVRYPRQQLGPSRGLFRLALKLVDEFQPHVVQFGHALPTGLLGPAIAKRTGIPYLVFMGGTEITLPGVAPVSKRVLRYVLGNAAALAAVSDYTAGVASRHVKGRVPAFTVRPAIDSAFSLPSSLSRDDAKNRLGIDGELVVCVGRLVPRKGQDRLIEALALLRGAYPRLNLAIIGSGRIGPRLAAMAERLGVAERVRFTGALGIEKLQVWMAAADVFASPCRSRWAGLEVEGFGLVFAEASLAGLPVLVGRSGGAPESVKNGETGILVQGYFKEEVAEALSRLLSLSPEARVAMGQRARQFTLVRHNIEAAGERYREVLSRAARR